MSLRVFAMIHSVSLAVVLVVVIGAMGQSDEYSLHGFERQQLTGVYYSEGANTGDLNNDGTADVVYGPHWYAGPDFKSRSEIYAAKPQNRQGYADNFFSWVYDFNDDGWNDILVVGFPGTPAYVYENPQEAGLSSHWPKHEVFDWVSNESPHFINIVGDERPELVCTRDGFFGFATIDWSEPFEAWKFHAISGKVTATRFGHGLGVGDLNGDGLADLIHAKGWFQQPAKNATKGRWLSHDVAFTDSYGGAEMHAYDVDGDGDNDVITSLAAHDFGLAWYEQIQNGDTRSFQQHVIMGDHPSQNRYGVLFSELHSVNLADIDGDGLKDIVTGKTFYSHHRQSPMWDAGAVVYWFRLVRGEDSVDWVPYKADGESGIGRQVIVADINSDRHLDMVVGGMKGAHVLTHTIQRVDEAAWRESQPKPQKAQTTGLNATASRAEKESSSASPGDGTPAVSDDGRPLNLDFETGTLQDWTAKGKAFTGQPIKGDTVNARRRDMHSNHKGQYWIGGYEKVADRPIGTLTSVEFKVTRPFASYFAGGGKHHATRIELVRHDSGKTIHKIAGRQREDLHRVVVDLREHIGKEIFIRLVDNHRGGWGHVNFDHFRFHDSQPGPLTPPLIQLVDDEYPHAGISAEEAAQAMRLPEGFSVTVSASEPDVKQPIAMALDDRGRVWIAEAYEYPKRAPEGQGRHRILDFDDKDGDGRFDERKVFAEGLNLVSGLEIGFGGVWVGAAPYLLFIPDRDANDVPDGKPQVLLDGWGYHDTHETLNAFIWGPDGWLYGCHGVFTHSLVGKPGTPEENRIPLNAGIWRYHPRTHAFEVFAHGTSNPWGIDFNDHGQAFCTACVIPHLYHVIQGARYQRQSGQHFNQHTYRDIVTIADHLHYLGATPHGGNNKSDQAGGGHAHAGAMIYLGDAWPKKYRNQLFMNNIHGQRLNVDVLQPNGSGYVGSHGPDFLLTGDRASQILNLRYGPDGHAYMIDWYDMQACHLREVEKHDRSNGRIYKITYGKSAEVDVDLDTRGDIELAEMMLHPNDWYVRHARRILQERAAVRPIDRRAVRRLEEIIATHPDDTRRLRAVWGLHVTGELSEHRVIQLLADSSPYVRGWAIQLATERIATPPSAELLAHLSAMARDDGSPIVRLYLASALQRLPLEKRWDILTGLVEHAEDAGDHNLPLMYWYAAEPLAELEPQRALALGILAGDAIPLLRQFMLRRIGASRANDSLALLTNGLSHATTDELRLTYLKSMRTALLGTRRVDAPPNWKGIQKKLASSDSPDVRLQASALSMTFGDERAARALRAMAASTSADTKSRREAIEALLAANDPALVRTLQGLMNDPDLRAIAIRGLAQYDEPTTARMLLECYDELPTDEKRLVLATLCSRPEYGAALLSAIERDKIKGSDLTADLVRQLQYLDDDAIDQQLRAVWGNVRETAAEKAKMIDEYKRMVSMSRDVDLPLGRAVFSATCQRCHVLYGVGEHVGPDLTGSNRSDIDYLLSNIVDPSAVMAKEYQQHLIITSNGRLITGIITSENDTSVTIQTPEERLIVPISEIDERLASEKSMMPDDQLKQFTQREIRSLIAYLRGKTQVPMLATNENSATLFNGKDLTGWTGNTDLWSVEDGEIVGRTSSLTRNEFLVSDLTARDFRLQLEVKLLDDAGNSGIQFRSQFHNGSVSGYQADIGPGWWGKLYEEHGRALLWDKPAEEYVKKGQWNKYEIIAVGSTIRTLINGKPCVDLTDPDGSRQGIFAFQLHSGGPTEVRFRDIRLEVLEGKDSGQSLLRESSE